MQNCKTSFLPGLQTRNAAADGVKIRLDGRELIIDAKAGKAGERTYCTMIEYAVLASTTKTD